MEYCLSIFNVKENSRSASKIFLLLLWDTSRNNYKVALGCSGAGTTPTCWGKSHHKARKVRKDIAAMLCVLCQIFGVPFLAFSPNR